jgi:hypothetical protein
MPPVVIDLTIVVLILGMTYALMSEGLWGAALMFFNVLFAGLIAFNFYEPVAAWLAGQVSQMSGYADTLCLMGFFIIALVILRLTTESLAPSMVRYPSIVYHIGRIAFGFAGSMVTMAILLVAFHTNPGHKKIFGVVDYKYEPPFHQGLDHKWLAFFQFTSGQVFATYTDTPEPHGEYSTAKVFDPYGDWLINHQNERPYGPATDKVPEPPAAPAAGGGGGGEGGAGGGGPGPGPGPAADNAPRVPGGTAGAAVGLAPM